MLSPWRTSSSLREGRRARRRHRRGVGTLELRGLPLGVAHPDFGERVARHEPLDDARQAVLLLGELPEDQRHRRRVVAGGVHEPEAEPVRLGLLPAAVAQQRQHVAELRPLPRDRRNRDGYDGDGGDDSELAQVLRRQHLGRVSRRDVAHLVRHDRGELVLRLADLDDAHVQVDRTAGQREGVHLGRIDDVVAVGEELERRLGARVEEAAPDGVHHLVERAVTEKHEVGFHFLRELLAEPDVAVERVEVRVEAMHAGAPDDEPADDGDPQRRSLHGPPARSSARRLLGCTLKCAPEASTSGSRSPTISPDTRSPLRSATSALLPASVKSTRSTSAADTSIVRPPMRRRSGANAAVTPTLSPLRSRARNGAGGPAARPAARRLSCAMPSTGTPWVRPTAARWIVSFSRKPLSASPFASTTRARPRSPVSKMMVVTTSRGSSTAPYAVLRRKRASPSVPRSVSPLRSFAVSTSAPPRTCCASRSRPPVAMSAGRASVQISQPFSPRCWKASVRPSGDQAGWSAGAGAAVSSIGAVPSAFATHGVASLVRPCAGQRVKASLVPSRDHAGRAS